jgi:shikimate dehydrogenase
MPDTLSTSDEQDRLFGLIGYPLSHSFSRKYFTDKFEKEHILHTRYELFPIASIGGLPDLLRKNSNLRGLNVTIPYKEEVLRFLSEKDDLVKEIGACNCVRVNKDGRLRGFNTDAIGFKRSLEEHLRPHHQKALVLGTGGGAKAVQYILRTLGIAYIVVSRTPKPGQLTYDELSPALVADHSLIINTTPLGMHPNEAAAAALPYDALTVDHYLYDLVYNPGKTLFLRKGEERGAAIKNGYDMLVLQAEESWRIWNMAK